MTETLPTTDDSVQQPDDVVALERDLLVNMFIQQMHHKKAYDEIYRAKGLNPPAQGEWGNLNNPAIQLEARTTFAYLVEEIMEAFNLLKNKPWKQTPRPTDPEEFYKELGDAWHFWLELMIVVGMTPDLIAKYYFGESKKNDQRRAEGY
jgi:hypothetical protein